MNPQTQNAGMQMVHGVKLVTLAFELGLITREQMGRALVLWLPQPQTSMLAILVDAGFLSEIDRDLLERLAERHADTAVTDSNLQPVNQYLSALTVGNSASPAVRLAAQTLSRTLQESSPEKNDAAAGEEFIARGLTELNASSHRFRLLKPYAVGGLGVVSVAHDVELDREVAVKEIRPNATSEDAVQRFMLEARVTGQLDHPGIPPVYALGYFEDGRPFYVMRLIEGVTLKEAIAAFHARFPPPDTSRERSLELRKLLGSVVSVCNTLRFAHSRNVLHRDIKPSNIMLGEYGETLVLDWGLAKSKEQSLPFSINDAKAHHTKRKTDDPTQTGTGSVMGTPHYMSPEQARGEWESVNVRSDVYSVGATLYSLLTGRLPFSGTTRDEVREQVRQGNFIRPRQVDARVPEALDAICIKAMALQREDRFANTGELASEIEHWLADEPINSFRESAFQRWQRWVKARQSLVASMILLLATGFVALAIGFITVSSRYRTANQATDEAQQISRKGLQHLTQARELVLSFLLVDNDKRLALLPGTESMRMQMIDEAIHLLTAWSQDEPINAQYQLSLAAAYRERHRIHRIMHQPQAAWSDLMRSLGIVEQCLIAMDSSVRSLALNYHFSLLNDATELVKEVSDNASSMQLAVEARARVLKLLERRPNDIASKVTMVHVNLLLAQLLLENDQPLHALELSDEAATFLKSMMHSTETTDADPQVIGGRDVIMELDAEAQKMQALSWHALGDRRLATRCAQQTLAVLNETLQKKPTNQLTAENILLLGRLELLIHLETGQLSSAGVRQEFAHFLDRAQDFSRRFPTNQIVWELLNDAQLLEIDYLISQGRSEEAIEVAMSILTRMDSLPSDRHTKSLRSQFLWNRIRLNIRLSEACIEACQFELGKVFLSSATQDLLVVPTIEKHPGYEVELERLQAAERTLNPN